MKISTITRDIRLELITPDAQGFRAGAELVKQGRRWTSCLLLLLVFVAFLNKEAQAQCSGPNLLTNPSFEAPVVPAGQNNIVTSIPGWTNRSSNNGVSSTSVNVYRPTATETQTAPSAANGSQYIDLLGDLGIMDQTFTLTSPAVVVFSGSFANRVPTSPSYTGGTIAIQILNTAGDKQYAIASGTLSAANGIQWVTLSGRSSLLQPGTYVFRFFARTDWVNFDNMSVCVATNAAQSCANRTVLKPQPGWSATASGALAGYPASRAIDGSTQDNAALRSLWVTPTTQAVGQHITFDYGTPLNLVGFVYYPRTATDQQSINGYTVQTSNDGVTFTTVQTGSISNQDVHLSTAGPLGNPLEVDFSTAVTARYMRLIINSTNVGYGSIAELLPIVCAAPTLNTISCANADLLNTGTNSTGTGLGTLDRFDANWEVAFSSLPAGYTQPMAFSAVSNATYVPAIITGNKVPGTWANSPFGNANWISYTQTSYDANAVTITSPNTYFFRYRFNITDPYLLPAFKLKLNFLSDNNVQNIYINGVGQAPQFGLPGGGFFLASQTQTELKTGWQLGQNEIIVQIYSEPDLAGFLGQNITSCPGLDFGDAPASYNVSRTTSGAGHIVETDQNNVVLIKLGTLIDAEADGVASTTATSDNTTGQNDEDGVSFFPVIQGTNNKTFTNYTLTVALSNNTGSAATLCGWIDWNNNGTFDASEAVCVTVPKGATSAQLVWPSATLTGVTTGRTGTYARFRITTDALASNSANGAASNGEVEDYFIPFCLIEPPVATLVTPATICSGAPVNITYATNPTGQTVQWLRMPGGISGIGAINDQPTATGTTPVSYTYSAWINNAAGGCSSTTVTTGVTVNPVPIVTPSVCSQTICAGQTGAITFTSSLGGTTINWLRVEDGQTGTGNISQVFGTAGSYTYKVWGVSTGTSCPSSSTITCTVVVKPGLTVTASVAAGSTGCLGTPLSLSAAVSSAGTYTYSWTGPNGFVSNQQNPQVSSSVTAAMSGSYTVVVTDASGCAGTAVVPVSVTNCCTLTATASSNSPQCTGNPLQLTGLTQGGSGSLSYSWRGPNGFSSTAQSPTLAASTTAASGSYTLVVTDTGVANCSVTAVTGVTIASSPSLTISGGSSQTVCSGQSTTLTVGGANGATVSWTNSLGQSGTGSTINFAGLINVSGASKTITYMITAQAGTCSDVAVVTLTVKPAPDLQVVPGQAVVCALEAVNLRASSSQSTATVSWSRTPTSPSPASGSGTGSVTVSDQLPAGSYSYSFQATASNGCSSPVRTVPLTVNN